MLDNKTANYIGLLLQLKFVVQLTSENVILRLVPLYRQVV
jgi:hypothetical protein